MESPLSSKNLTSRVKVEFTDPSGVYQLIESELQARLPLRNLNWSSPGRPVRSIESLYIDPQPDEKTAASQLPKRSTSLAGITIQGESERPLTPTSGDLKRQPDAPGSKRERRHQIPGLRRTPYLKIYLLRCDDAEIYKNSARKLLRDWIKLNTPPSQVSTSSSSQDNHDAFEWLIIHVVLPDPQGLTTWPSKGSFSVLDKVRADFNGSSRGAVDRVAQVPAARDLQVRGTTIPGIPPGPAREPFLSESGKAWDDLIGKVKELILTSFDLRVRQYEEDIKEKGAQRSLPGWNFCTFFVLKEGLARGFESVGIFEDALMGYDELSAELQSALREEASKTSLGTEAKLFREHTQELLVQAERALQGNEQLSTRPTYKQVGNSILDTSRKSYRELILSNNISAFDFRTYVFARQVSLLLHSAARGRQQRSVTSRSGEGDVQRDVGVLEEICRRAIGYVADIAGIMRQDLKASFKSDDHAGDADIFKRNQVVENLISSYIFSCAEQILAKTQHSSLPSLLEPEFRESDEDEYEDDLGELASHDSESQKEDDQTASKHIRQHPALADQPVANPSENQFSYEKKAFDLPERSLKHAGICRLASVRAHLFLITRRTLSAVGSRCGWLTAWHGGTKGVDGRSDQFEEVALEVESSRACAEHVDADEMKLPAALNGLSNKTLFASLSDEETFQQVYEKFSLAAFKLFLLCEDQKSAYTITADIAFLRCRTGNYIDAVRYCRELASFYALNGWLELEINVLDAYSYCLKELGAIEDYIRVALRKLARQVFTVRPGNRILLDLDNATKANSLLGTSGPMELLSSSSQDLATPIISDMHDYFSNIQVEPYVRHEPNQDRFLLTCSFTSLVPGSFMAEKVSMWLHGANHAQAREICLVSGGSTMIEFGRCTLDLICNTVVPDWYVLDKLVLETNKIHLQHHFQNVPTSPIDHETKTVIAEAPFPKILVWPSPESLKVSITLHHLIHLEEPRAIYVEIQSGSNEVRSASLILKSGSAGLRIHNSEAKLVHGNCEIANTIRGNELQLAEFGPRSRIGIRIPYKLDADMKEILLRSEITYSTDRGSYVRGDSHRMSTQLPLGVNVQDVFKEHHLFSKFAISTASRFPLRLLGCQLSENASFEISSPYMESRGLCIHEKQPVALVYRITPRSTRPREGSVESRLSMSIEYRCLDEEIISCVQSRLLKHLEGSELWIYEEPLQQHLTTVLHDHLSDQHELEAISVLREINLPPFGDFQWTRVLSAIPAKEQEFATLQLKHWHQENKVIKLPDEPLVSLKASKAPLRQIVIPVDIPNMAVLHRASLSIPFTKQGGGKLTVGKEIAAVLRISHTRRWAKPSGAAPEQALTFYYELEAPADTWLITGQRRTFFRAAEGEELTFQIVLVPLRAGNLMLPMLEVTPVKEEHSNKGKWDAMGCEVDYESQGTSVEVFPGIRSVTVEVGDGEGGDGGVEPKHQIRIVEVER